MEVRFTPARVSVSLSLVDLLRMWQKDALLWGVPDETGQITSVYLDPAPPAHRFDVYLGSRDDWPNLAAIFGDLERTLTDTQWATLEAARDFKLISRTFPRRKPDTTP